MNKAKKIAIVGGGIGGLTLAIALQQKGFSPVVYERTPELKSVGAGLGLAGNAVKAFSELDLNAAVLKAGKILKRVAIKDERGRVLTETDSEKMSEKYGMVNNFTVHRADLHEVLLNQLTDKSLVLDKQCVDFEQYNRGVQLFFQDGTHEYVDYVIACDGINSVFRKKLLPKAKPRYAGYTCWRAVIDDVPAGIDMSETSETWGPGSRFGIVPLTHNRIYWFATINSKANNSKLKAYTTSDLSQHFKDFHHPIPQLIEQTKNEQLIWSDINDLEPIKKFAFNRIVLMGDAAHATTPNMGQGACITIEDAVVLANCMEDYAKLEESFRQFEKKRIGRTTRIVNNSWQLGKIAQLENPLIVKIRNAAIRATPARIAERQLQFLQEVSFL